MQTPLDKAPELGPQEIEKSVARMRGFAVVSLGLGALIIFVIILLSPLWRLGSGVIVFGLHSLLVWSFIVTAYSFYCMYGTALRSIEVLHELSIIDETTKGYNYRYLMIRLNEEHERNVRHGTTTSLLYMDLDHFKQVNDLFGHQAGNLVLEDLATIMGGIMRRYDVLGRWGGDELLAILPETDALEASVLAERLREAVANYSLDMGQRGKIDFIRVSIGISAYPINGKTMDNVITAADKALYKAKEKGGNTVSISDENIDTAAA